MKIKAVLLAFGLSMLLSTVSYAKTFTVTINDTSTKVNSVTVKVNDSSLNTAYDAYVLGGRTFVPIREISEKLGSTVNWDNATKSATIISGSDEVKLQIGSTVVYVNGQKNTISEDSIPQFAQYVKPDYATKTMVPLRFLSEALGYTVSWDQASQTASVDQFKTAAIAHDAVAAEKSNNGAATTVDKEVIEPKDSDGYRSLNELKQRERASDKELEVPEQTRRTISETIEKQGAVTVVVDPGHGGKDPGTNNDSVKEKELNLKVAKLLKPKLQSLGYEVLMTRDSDEYLTLLERAEVANENDAEIFVSIHFNYSTNSDASGIETFYADEKTVGIKAHVQKYLADAIQKELIRVTGANNRGVKNGSSYVVLNKTKTVAALTELGFVSNADEARRFEDEAYLNDLATAIANGIENYVAKYVK
ncbi:N-acetylmuramoyl-L-alanine amidase [Peptoniphilus equinus]|uniref:N-acetylmuramoyl-L-alanine amidase n=1 Tax=Peptoniphilus equinus TaxID=3016343 RepID=A0ABY7QR64_9FIRM|nr:N-acetylmuramoyl-L-alanine amidase [Peptoniphilus equinus]WBW49280.1 N-acetylmuramoyl-L-alanine amidase [Peptoniphilus equinus]